MKPLHEIDRSGDIIHRGSKCIGIRLFILPSTFSVCLYLRTSPHTYAQGTLPLLPPLSFSPLYITRAPQCTRRMKRRVRRIEEAIIKLNQRRVLQYSPPEHQLIFPPIEYPTPHNQRQSNSPDMALNKTATNSAEPIFCAVPV